MLKPTKNASATHQNAGTISQNTLKCSSYKLSLKMLRTHANVLKNIL